MQKNESLVKQKKQKLLKLTEEFCEEHLDEEYKGLCHKLIEKMARKRSVPFLRGREKIWAAAVVHAIGTINFLFDKSFEPYVSLAEIADHFRTSRSTVTNKSRLIQDMFKMRYWDKQFSTARIEQENPFKNMVMIDGAIFDVRELPREVQRVLRGHYIPMGAKPSGGQRKRTGLPRGMVRDRTKRRDTKAVYQFRITLKETKPPIWRRIEVPGTYTLYDLHVAIQDAMGWADYHLHEFRFVDPHTGAEVDIGIPGEEFEEPDDVLPDWEQSIADWFSIENRSSDYMYDFGDGWEHLIRLEKILHRQEGVQYPRCVAGKRACPPEDCGGVYGYKELLEIIVDKNHERYEEMIAWLGGGFDPEYFRPEDVAFDDPDRRFKLAGWGV